MRDGERDGDSGKGVKKIRRGGEEASGWRYPAEYPLHGSRVLHSLCLTIVSPTRGSYPVLLAIVYNSMVSCAARRPQ